MALREAILIVISYIFLTVVLFAPQVLATILNVGADIVTGIIWVLAAIPWLFYYLIGFLVYIAFGAIDWAVEKAYDVIAFWDTKRDETDNIPNLGDTGTKMMKEALQKMSQPPTSIPHVTVPKRSFAQQVVDIIADLGVPKEVAWIILILFFAVVTYIFIMTLKEVVL